jgi:hypothetical protein
MPLRQYIFIVLAASIVCASEARADFRNATLPDGAYHCEVYLLGAFINLGDIAIKGNVYSGPSYFGGAGQKFNYQLSDEGDLTWLGPLGGYTSGGNSISLTQVTLSDPKNASFDIIMRQPDGAFTASTCTIRAR